MAAIPDATLATFVDMTDVIEFLGISAEQWTSVAEAMGDATVINFEAVASVVPDEYPEALSACGVGGFAEGKFLWAYNAARKMVSMPVFVFVCRAFR